MRLYVWVCCKYSDFFHLLSVRKGRFIREDDAIQNDVPGYGELLEKTFEKEVAQKFLEKAQERQEFLDHIKSLAEEWDSE